MQFCKKHKNQVIPQTKKWPPRIKKMCKIFSYILHIVHLQPPEDRSRIFFERCHFLSNLMKIEFLVVFKFVGDNLHYDQILKIILVAHSNNLSVQKTVTASQKKQGKLRKCFIIHIRFKVFYDQYFVLTMGNIQYNRTWHFDLRLVQNHE